jgi:ferredoxin-thioredoxin reductase catalytic subunit
MLLGLFFDPQNGGYVSPKRRFIFNGLHGVISQKKELFEVICPCA